jgi:cation diffusion facilitator CzcD-associated flavoprotein CzcO
MAEPRRNQGDTMTESTDVVVIDGGCAGVAATDRLTQPAA